MNRAIIAALIAMATAGAALAQQQLKLYVDPPVYYQWNKQVQYDPIEHVEVIGAVNQNRESHRCQFAHSVGYGDEQSTYLLTRHVGEDRVAEIHRVKADIISTEYRDMIDAIELIRLYDNDAAFAFDGCFAFMTNEAQRDAQTKATTQRERLANFCRDEVNRNLSMCREFLPGN